MDTRIGYPNEHLSVETKKFENSPILSTVVGLLMNSIESSESINEEDLDIKSENINDQIKSDEKKIESSSLTKNRKTIFDKWADKFKEFLDKA